jgi:hypothetical protein
MHLSLQRFRYAKLSSRHACTADVHCASNDTRRARRRRRRRRCAVASRILCRTRSRSSRERPRSQARVASVGDNERSARFVCVSRSQLTEQTVELCRYLRSRPRVASAVQLSILQVVAVERYAASARTRFSIRIERNYENSSFACAGRRQSMSALSLAVGLLSRSIVVVSSRRCNVMPTTDNIVGTLSASRCRHDYHNISIAASFCLCCRRRSSPPISTTSARWQSILAFAANSPRRSSNSARSTATTRSI